MTIKEGLQANIITIEQLKKRNPSPGVYNFEGFLKRPEEENLVEKTRKSMEKNTGKPVTEQEAKSYLKIAGAWSESISAKKKKEVKQLPDKPTEKKLICIDGESADKGAKHTISGWSKWWREQEDGRVMASPADIYKGLYQMRVRYHTGDKSVREYVSDTMSILKMELKLEALLAGILLDFGGNRLNEVTMYHHYNCKYKNLITKSECKLPRRSCELENIISFASEPVNLEFIRQFFGTRDDIKRIAKNISFVTGVTMDKINIMAPSAKEIAKSYFRTAGFNLESNGSLTICTYKSMKYRGLSRGYTP